MMGLDRRSLNLSIDGIIVTLYLDGMRKDSLTKTKGGKGKGGKNNIFIFLLFEGKERLYKIIKISLILHSN